MLAMIKPGHGFQVIDNDFIPKYARRIKYWITTFEDSYRLKDT